MAISNEIRDMLDEAQSDARERVEVFVTKSERLRIEAIIGRRIAEMEMLFIEEVIAGVTLRSYKLGVKHGKRRATKPSRQ